MRAVNLWDRQEADIQCQKRRWIILAAATLVGTGFFLVMTHVLLKVMTRYEGQRADQILKQLAAFEGRQQAIQSLQSAVLLLQQHARYRQAAHQLNTRLMAALQTIAQPPTGLVVTAIVTHRASRLSSEVHAAFPVWKVPVSATQLTVGGKYQASVAVYRWLQALQHHPAIRNVQLKTIRQDEEGSGGHFLLAVRC